MDRGNELTVQGQARRSLPSSRRVREPWQDRVWRTVCYVVSTVWVSFTLFPLVWLLGSTFKDPVDVLKMPPDFLPRPPRIYTLQFDFSDLAAESPEALERAVREDLALAVWRVPDYLGAIHLGRIVAEGYVDGRKIAEAALSKHDYAAYRSELWVSNRITDRLVRRELERALWAADFRVDLGGDLRSARAGTATVDTAKISALFGDVIQPTSRFIGVTERYHWPSLFNNFITAWRAPSKLYPGMSVLNYFANGLIITGCAIALQWIVSGLAAYALSRILTPRYSRLWTVFFLVTMMVPFVAILIPIYELVGQLGLHDKLGGVILPGIPGAFTIYLFKGFFDALPSELFDAARIDGASELSIFSRITAPMSKNVFTVIALLTFMGSWNSFFWPYLVLRSPKMWTFTIAIYMAMGGSGSASTSYGNAMAMSVMASLPTILVFALFSRSIQQGLVWSGLKG